MFTSPAVNTAGALTATGLGEERDVVVVLVLELVEGFITIEAVGSSSPSSIKLTSNTMGGCDIIDLVVFNVALELVVFATSTGNVSDSFVIVVDPMVETNSFVCF